MSVCGSELEVVLVCLVCQAKGEDNGVVCTSGIPYKQNKSNKEFTRQNKENTRTGQEYTEFCSKVEIILKKET